MDFFNLDITLELIEKSDKKLIEELDNITFEYDKLSREGDKLLQNLNYTPKVKKPDKGKIQNLPFITIPQLSELQNLDFSVLSTNSKKIISPINIKDEEKFDMIKSILFSIIDKAIEDTNNIYDLKIYEDEDEEFDRMLLKYKKKSEDEEEKRDKDFSISSSRFGLDMNLINQIKVYLFNNNDYIIINITPKDKIKSIKEKIIKKIIETNKYNLKHSSYEAYEIRIIDEEHGDKFIMGSPLENNESVFKEKVSTIAFLENPKYIPENINEEDEFKLEEEKDDKINLKIYYKKNGISGSKLFVVSKEDTLKMVLDKFFEQNILKDKNIDQYYFIEHNAIRDIENEINLDTNIKYLATYELTLCNKDDFDLPEMINEYSNIEIKKNLFNSGNDDNFKNEKSRFNEISAGIYQEFEVYKINKYKMKKKRILGIDMYHIYNNLPKKNNSGIMNIIFIETKHPVRNVENIIECLSIRDNGFYIDIKDEEKNQIKKLNYETKNTEIRDEIVDKINFLINYHHNNN